MPGAERRQATRLSGNDGHGILRVRVRPGQDVNLIDVSANGALIETCHRLLPGSTIDLHLVTQESNMPVRGRVLRCAVARLRPAAIFYRGAIGFDRSVPWLVRGAHAEGGCVPGEDVAARRAGRAPASPSIVA